MHPDVRQSFGDRMICILHGNCERHAIAMVSGAAGFVVRDQLAVFEIPERARFFGPAAPSSDADHFVERRPSRERIVGRMNDYEAAAAADV